MVSDDTSSGLVSTGTELSPEELVRYSRHTLLPEIGIEGQKRLKNARVLVVGLGGLGSPLALYLTAAGVGTLGLVEFDTVDLSNLQRQLLFRTTDIRRPKLEVAKQLLAELNPEVTFIEHPDGLNESNALQLVSDYDLVVDGTDNFTTRYLVNDACVLAGKPNVYGSIFRFEGQASIFWASQGPCYRCLFPEPPPAGVVPSCAEGGVLGILPGIIGTVQATEAIKLLLGLGSPLIGRLLLYDALGMKFREVKVRRDSKCPICGDNPTITELKAIEPICEVEQTGSEMSQGFSEITPQELKQRLDAGEDVFVLDVRQPEEHAVCHLPEAMLIPLGDLPNRVSELDSNQEIVVHCKMGGRSAQAAQFLSQNGFNSVKNLTGGINAWAETVDPSMPKY